LTSAFQKIYLIVHYRILVNYSWFWRFHIHLVQAALGIPHWVVNMSSLLYYHHLFLFTPFSFSSSSFHFMQVREWNISKLFSAHNLSFLFLTISFFSVSSGTWPICLFLGHPICFFPLNFNSKALLSIHVLSSAFTWWNHCNLFSSN
jgi:hypothetical protein